MISYKEITIKSTARCHWIDITGFVNDILRDTKISKGICCVSSMHTTAGITINENADPDVEHDFFRKLALMVPPENGYRHTEGNSDSHIKASLVGLSVQVPIHNDQCVLGTWQAIYFCEFDGPRSRKVSVTIIGE